MKQELGWFLDKLTVCCYMTKNDLMPLTIFRGLHWTHKYGINDYSPIAFANTAIVLSGVLFNFKGGSVYATRALQLKDRVGSKLTEGRTLFLVYCCVAHFTELLKDLFKPMVQAYDVCMRNGDT